MAELPNKVKVYPGEKGLEVPFPVDKEGIPTSRRLREPHRHQEELIGRTEHNEPRVVRVDDLGQLVVSPIAKLADIVDGINSINDKLSELLDILTDVEETFE